MEHDTGIKEVTIYTDGACRGNPGPGGYGVVLMFGKFRKEISAGYRITTNNRMELLAAVTGLAALRFKCKVRLFSDSKYVVDSMTKGWVQRWESNNWMRNKKEPAQNRDLWKALLSLCDKHLVTFVWVRGHRGHSENERCDTLAVNASLGSQLLIDRNFEQQNYEQPPFGL